MFRRPGDRRWRSLSLIGVAIYAAFLVMAPFAHHDLLCHLKSPQHCSSCTSSQLGADPHTPTILGGHLLDAGQAIPPLIISNGRLVAVRTPGRSPPARS